MEDKKDCNGEKVKNSSDRKNISKRKINNFYNKYMIFKNEKIKLCYLVLRNIYIIDKKLQKNYNG